MAQRIRAFAASWLRRDGLALLLYLLATIVMTYPLAFRLDGSWLALRDTDTYVKLWDNWWLQERALKEWLFLSTPDLFHPFGLDLSFHSISWTVALLSVMLQLVLNAVTVYNLTVLLAVFLTAYGAYLLARSMVRRWPAAWLAGAIYSFAPYHMAHTGGHPDLTHLASIPIAVLLLTHALSGASRPAAIGAALFVSVAAFTSLYIMEFALLTVAPVVIYLALADQRWRRGSFRQTAALFGITSVLLLVPRVIPLLQSQEDLSFAIESKYSAAQSQTDLLSYALPSHHNPLFAPFVEDFASRFKMNSKWPAYLGLVPVVLTVAALTRKRNRSIALLWFVIGLIFAILSLGPVLRFNGQTYEAIKLPFRTLEWFGPLRAVRPDFFVLGLLLPLAICASLGFDRVLETVQKHRLARNGLAVLIPALLLFEYWNGPYPGIPAAVHPFYQQLAGEQERFALIELPMGRANAKRYLYLQTVHHKPMAEGLSARTPALAYQYIDNNALLARWRNATPLDCSTLPGDSVPVALDQLLSDGFRYVLIHLGAGTGGASFMAYFPAEAAYRDDYLVVFDLRDVAAHPPCF